MGILSGFIGGAARATGEIANQRIARYTAEEMARQRDLMDQEREKRIEEAQIAREGRVVAQHDKDRTDTVKRIDAETRRIVDTAITAKRGLIESGIQDRSSWTPEQQAVVDQSLAADRQGLINDIDTRYKASVNTGDTSLQNAALMEKQDRRLDVTEKKNDEATAFNKERLIMQDEWNKRQDNIRNRLASVQESRANRTEKKYDVQMEKAELQSTRLSLQSVLKDIATQEDKLQVQLSSPTMTDPEQQKIMLKKMEDLDALRVESRNYLLDLAGVKKEKPAATNDPFDAKVDAKLEAIRKGNAPQTQLNTSTGESAPAPSGRKIDTSARDADIARMNKLSGSSGNRESIITKKQEEISSNFEDKLSKIKGGMTRDEKFKLLTWFDENGGYMTPAQLKQVREAKSRAGM